MAAESVAVEEVGRNNLVEVKALEEHNLLVVVCHSVSSGQLRWFRNTARSNVPILRLWRGIVAAWRWALRRALRIALLLWGRSVASTVWLPAHVLLSGIVRHCGSGLAGEVEERARWLVSWGKYARP